MTWGSKSYKPSIDNIIHTPYTGGVMSALFAPSTGHTSIKAAAQRLGVHENTVRNWMDRDIVRSYRLPSGVRRISTDEVERLEREMFAVPTSFAEPAATKAPRATKPDYSPGKLP